MKEERNVSRDWYYYFFSVSALPWACFLVLLKRWGEANTLLVESVATTAALLAKAAHGDRRAGGSPGETGSMRSWHTYLKGKRKIYGKAEVRAQCSPQCQGSPSPASEFTTAHRTGHVPPREADCSAVVQGSARPSPVARAALLAFMCPVGQ